MKNIILSSLCVVLFTACSQNTVVNPPPSSTPSPTATAGTSNNQNDKFTYDLPVKFTLRTECEPKATKIEYELVGNTFSYNLNTNTYGPNPDDISRNDIKTVTLTQSQIDELKKLVQDADLAKLAKDDQKVPPGTPQTMECRTIGAVTINVNNKDTLFERNDREYIHTEAYRNAYDKLKQGFDQFKEKIVSGTSTSKNVEINKEFDLKISESAFIKDQNLTLTINKKTEESRCPTDVQCVWAGQVSFEMTFDNNGTKETFVLTMKSGTNDLAMKKVGDYTVRLVKVLPESFTSTNTPKDSDYILTLKIEK